MKGKRTYRFPLAAGFSAIVTDNRLRIPGATTSEGAETELAPHLIDAPMVEIFEPDRTDSQRKRLTATVVEVISMLNFFFFSPFSISYRLKILFVLNKYFTRLIVNSRKKQTDLFFLTTEKKERKREDSFGFASQNLLTLMTLFRFENVVRSTVTKTEVRHEKVGWEKNGN